MEGFWQISGSILIFGVMGVLCLIGVALSCLAFSGTWLVVVAAAVAALYRGGAFSWWLVLGFALLSGLIEVVEFFSSAWGIQRRGGSRLAGFAAVVGGLVGMLLGSLIPVPVIGSLAGMLAGSFGFAYLVEYRRLKKVRHASHIATGAVLARVFVIFIKVGGTLLMTVVLLLAHALR